MAELDTQQMQRSSMINRVGCIAVLLVVVLVVLIGTAFTYMSIDGKRRAVDKELDTLKNILLQGLDAPRPLGRYAPDEAAFNTMMDAVTGLKGRIEAAKTLPELEEVYGEYKEQTADIINLVSPAAAAINQAVRNQEAQIEGIFNRWRVQREKLMEAINRYNSALSNFPENVVGAVFGMKEAPTGSPLM